MSHKHSDADRQSGTRGVGGLFKGLTELIENLGELAEKGEELSRHGESGGKGIKGVYGFSVKVGLGDEGVKVEPFGNIHKDKVTGKSVIEGVREPLVDVFEEDDHILIVAEMPGIGVDDVQLQVQGDVLGLEAQKGDKRYSKEILLPRSCPREKMQMACNNGVLEIRCVH